MTDFLRSVNSNWWCRTPREPSDCTVCTIWRRWLAKRSAIEREATLRGKSVADLHFCKISSGGVHRECPSHSVRVVGAHIPAGYSCQYLQCLRKQGCTVYIIIGTAGSCTRSQRISSRILTGGVPLSKKASATCSVPDAAPRSKVPTRQLLHLHLVSYHSSGSCVADFL